MVLPFDVYPVNVYYDSRHIGYAYGKEWKFYRPWPLDLPKDGPTAEYAELWKKGFKAFQDHFDQHPEWNRTTPVVFLLSLDESYDEGSIDRMLYYGKLLKESGAKRLKQLRRSSQDYEYFWLLSQKGGRQEPDAAVASIIHDFAGKEGVMGSPGMWNHNPVLDRNLRQDRHPTLLE